MNASAVLDGVDLSAGFLGSNPKAASRSRTAASAFARLGLRARSRTEDGADFVRRDLVTSGKDRDFPGFVKDSSRIC